MKSESYSVLLISRDSKLTAQIKAFLTSPLFEVSETADFSEARRLVDEREFCIIIADSADGRDAEAAIEMSDVYAPILLLVPSEYFDDISYRVEAYGIMSAAKPFEPFYFYNLIKIAIAIHYKIQKISSQTIKLKAKMEEIRIVNRAKMLLIEKRGMSEEAAHHYLEKEAMNSGTTKRKVAAALARELIL